MRKKDTMNEHQLKVFYPDKSKIVESKHSKYKKYDSKMSEIEDFIDELKLNRSEWG